MKEEAVWTGEFETYDPDLEAISTWMDDYNNDRPLASLGERNPPEAGAEAAHHKTAA